MLGSGLRRGQSQRDRGKVVGVPPTWGVFADPHRSQHSVRSQAVRAGRPEIDAATREQCGAPRRGPGATIAPYRNDENLTLRRLQRSFCEGKTVFNLPNCGPPRRWKCVKAAGIPPKAYDRVKVAAYRCKLDLRALNVLSVVTLIPLPRRNSTACTCFEFQWHACSWWRDARTADGLGAKSPPPGVRPRS